MSNTEREQLLHNVSDIIRTAANISGAERVAASPEAQRLIHAWNGGEAELPFAREIGTTLRGAHSFPHVEAEVSTWGLQEIIQYTTRLATSLSGQSYLATRLTPTNIDRLDRLLRKGDYKPTVKAVKAFYMHEARRDDKDELARRQVPMVLLNMATAAALSHAYDDLIGQDNASKSIYERLDLASEHANTTLTRVCREVLDGVRPPQGESRELTIVRNAFRALVSCGNIGEEHVELREIMAPLLYVRTVGVLGLHKTAAEKEFASQPREYGQDRLRAALDASIKRLLARMPAAGFGDTEKLEAAIDGIRDNKWGGPVEGGAVNTALAQIRIKQVSRELLNAVAGGELDYASLYLTVFAMHSKALKLVAENVERRRAEERQAAEAEATRRAAEREQQRQAYLEQVKAQLEAIGLDWEVLPPGIGEPRPEGHTAEAGQARQTEIDPYRLSSLLEIQRAWGGQIYQSKFGRGPIPSQRRPGVQSEPQREVYLVLEFTDPDTGRVHAIAECAEVGNALYLLPGGLPGVPDWRLVFSRDRAYAFASGAFPINHPNSRVRQADPEGAAGRFEMKVLEKLFLSPEEYLDSWADERARHLARAAARATRVE